MGMKPSTKTQKLNKLREMETEILYAEPKRAAKLCAKIVKIKLNMD
jgi:hypothetical protein